MNTKGEERKGGRQKGTPNKHKGLKAILAERSEDYFAKTLPVEEVIIADPKKRAAFISAHAGESFTQFEVDMIFAGTAARIKTQTDLLKFHTPQMQATAIDLQAHQVNVTLTERLAALSEGKEITPEE